MSSKYESWLRDLVEMQDPFHDSLFVAGREPYEWTVPRDENRAEDGLELRQEYLREHPNGEVYSGPCTITEFLIGLAIRMNEILYEPAWPDMIAEYFSVLLDNLGVLHLSDLGLIRAQLGVLRGTDGTSATGTLFPLSVQTDENTEIWYQLHCWIDENMG